MEKEKEIKITRIVFMALAFWAGGVGIANAIRDQYSIWALIFLLLSGLIIGSLREDK